MSITPILAQMFGGEGGGMVASLLPLVLIFVVFYFLLIRPQQKRVKEHKAMVEALRRGDRVVTAGGLIGKVSKVLNDSEIQVEIAENVKVRVQRGSITAVLAKTDAPADDTVANDDSEK